MKPYLSIPLALVLLLLALGLAAAAAVVGAYQYLLPGLPDARELREIRLQVPLSIYSRDGRLIAQMGERRRDPVTLDEIPLRLRQAFLAAEDERFYSHPGFDLQGITRAAIGWVSTGRVSRGGGSTITQQLAKITFLSPEQTVVRKTREIFLARRIEEQLSKDEILELYLNKLFLGQRAYGVSAAGQVFFGKSLAELNLAEMATIAGLPQAPSLYNPVRSPQMAETRRSYVLRRMLEAGFITREEHDEARQVPMLSRLHGPRLELEAPYVAELVRAEMLERYGQDVYEAGFRVVTTIDSRLQREANRALHQALLEYDRRHGWRGPLARLDAEALRPPPNVDAARHYHALLTDFQEPAVLRVGLVTAVGQQHAQVHLRRHGEVRVGWSGLSWARRQLSIDSVGPVPREASEVVAPGDVVYLVELADGRWSLAQLPEAQGALVALDPADGAITSMVGGFDYFVSKFNRATQARRQPGSVFKPFVFSAALEHGYTAASIVNDAPLVFESSELEQAWRPENYSRQWGGPTRMREALVRSLNLVSVRVVLGAGVGNTISHLQAFGLPDTALPRNPTLALGAGAATPLELTAGYAVFANGGYRITPHLIQRIEDGAGNVLFEAAAPAAGCFSCVDNEALPLPGSSFSENMTAPDYRNPFAVAPAQVRVEPTLVRLERLNGADLDGRPERRLAPRVISPQNAWIIGDMLADVIRRGTGQRARRDVGRDDIVGKTGTSNDRRDAWFSGYNGDLVATAWVGFDQERTLGVREEGGRTALPMWNYFMAPALAGTPASRPDRPPGLVEVRISRTTGLVSPAGSPGTMLEVFEMGRVPRSEEGRNGERPSQRREEFDDSTLF
jgi:penicillin-binding protein 1A